MSDKAPLAARRPPGEYFPSRPLPAPCGNGSVCAECARHGMTHMHFNSIGLCPAGHQLEEAAG